MAKQCKDVESLIFFFSFKIAWLAKVLWELALQKEKNGEIAHFLDCITPSGATKIIS